MIRISKLSDYAILILCAFSEQGTTKSLSSTFIANQLSLSVPITSKILKLLTEAQFLQSKRGSEGGYHLHRLPNEIRLLDVIQAIEGKMAITECCHTDLICKISSLCGMKHNWFLINQRIKSIFHELSIQDMLMPLKAEMKKND